MSTVIPIIGLIGLIVMPGLLIIASRYRCRGECRPGPCPDKCCGMCTPHDGWK